MIPGAHTSILRGSYRNDHILIGFIPFFILLFISFCYDSTFARRTYARVFVELIETDGDEEGSQLDFLLMRATVRKFNFASASNNQLENLGLRLKELYLEKVDLLAYPLWPLLSSVQMAKLNQDQRKQIQNFQKLNQEILEVRRQLGRLGHHLDTTPGGRKDYFPLRTRIEDLGQIISILNTDGNFLVRLKDQISAEYRFDKEVIEGFRSIDREIEGIVKIFVQMIRKWHGLPLKVISNLDKLRLRARIGFSNTQIVTLEKFELVGPENGPRFYGRSAIFLVSRRITISLDGRMDLAVSRLPD